MLKTPYVSSPRACGRTLVLRRQDTSPTEMSKRYPLLSLERCRRRLRVRVSTATTGTHAPFLVPSTRKGAVSLSCNVTQAALALRDRPGKKFITPTLNAISPPRNRCHHPLPPQKNFSTITYLLAGQPWPTYEHAQIMNQSYALCRFTTSTTLLKKAWLDTYSKKDLAI